MAKKCGMLSVGHVDGWNWRAGEKNRGVDVSRVLARAGGHMGLPFTDVGKNGKWQLSGGKWRFLAGTGLVQDVKEVAGCSVTDDQGEGPPEASFPPLSGAKVDPTVKCTSEGYGQN